MKIFVLCGVLCFASAEFFHESSGVELKPSGGHNNSAFGSAIAYQGSKPPRLVVGAPKEDYVGIVYNCPLSDLSTEINCSKIDMTSLDLKKKLEKARAYINPKQNYYFGSSLAATSKHFFTCAPMLPRTIKKGPSDLTTNTYGGCYVHDNTTYTEWIDNSLRFDDKFVKPSKYFPKLSIIYSARFQGGALGTSTLAEDDGYFIAAKSSYVGDILYVDSATPKDVTKSLVNDFFDKFHTELSNLHNLGYGLAAGYFFDKSTKLYAVSARVDLNGKILFLKKNYRSSYLEIYLSDDESFIYIENESLSSMFGYAMAALDMNADGLSELLVGAPAESDDGKQELGALHIYVGGDLQSRNDKKRMRTVLADKKDGRFGSAIAISDIDSDGISEIIVSSPYEEFGVVYVISGYELNQVFFRESGFKVVKLSELKLTQRLRGDSGSRLFGFSLRVVKDVDDNGCDELAIGSPESSAVRLVRCLPAVNASLTLDLKGEKIVDVGAKYFTVSVCLNVTLSSSCTSAIGTIEVECSATGKVNIKDPIYKYEITTDPSKTQYCKDIRVDFKETAAVANYEFSTKLSLLRHDSYNTSDYKSWAVLSPYSKKERSILVPRLCAKRDCEPNLQYQWVWSGNDTIDTSKPMKENLTFTLTNNGSHAAYRVVLDLKVKGALVGLGDCVKNGLDAYTCELEKELKTNEPYTMTVPIYVNKHSNEPGYLEVSASLYDAVFPNKTYRGEPLHKKFAFDANEVSANGSNNSFEVTDKDLEDDEIIVYRDIHHDYVISNDGAVTWYGLNAVITVKNESYIENVKIVSTEYCSQQNTLNDNEFQFSCKFTLKPNTSATIAANIEVSKKILENAFYKIGSNLGLNSKMTVLLRPFEEIREAKASTDIHYNQILTTGNKKWLIVLIVVLVAILILLIIMFVLYKYGFFKRTMKKQLSEVRESVRRRSVRMASQSSRSVKPSLADGDIGICEMEVVDDCVFHEVDMKSLDPVK